MAHKSSLETEPTPISAEAIAEVVEADIVVVGAGPAGLSAAASAAEKGAKVVLLEKYPRIAAPGGPGAPFLGSKLQKTREADGIAPMSDVAAMMGGGPPPGMPPAGMPPMSGPAGLGGPPEDFPGMPSPPMVQECGPVPSKEEIVRDLWEASAGRADLRLIKIWADGSGETADWLIDMADEQGIQVMVGRFSHFFSRPGISPLCLDRTPIGCREADENDGELCLLLMIARTAAKHGCDIRCGHAAERLIRQESGRVTGVIARRQDGSYVRVNAAKAVILATGDYGMDDAMLGEYCPWVLGLPKLMLPTVTGDGHRMAMWVGAKIEDGPHCAMLHFNSTNETPVVHWRPVGMMSHQSNLYVNKLGERIVDESLSHEFQANIVMRQPGKSYFQVFDAKSVNDSNCGDVDKCTLTGAVLKGDTVEELAVKLGADPKVLQATIDRYNELVELGRDEDFGKDSKYMTSKVDTAPYYVCESPPDLLCVMGGIQRNLDGQVLDGDFKVIPGLYAAGNVASGFWGDTYPMGVMGGIARSHALVFGRQAGIHAAGLAYD